MGIDDTVPYSKILDFSGFAEISRISDWACRREMKLVPKDGVPDTDGTPMELTWWNGSDDYEPAGLDHVVASDHLDIRKLSGEAGISVLGWPELPSTEWRTWIANYSDHALLYFEVWGE